jgi:hypothetical protein
MDARRAVFAVLLALTSWRSTLAQEPTRFTPPDPPSNWTAPPYWMQPTIALQELSDEKSAGSQISPEAVEAVPTAPLAFTGIPPCRLADTRGNGFSGQYGPPKITPAGRTITIANVCGIPATAQAVSFNFSAVNIPGAGFLVAYPAGEAFPASATMAYNQNTPNLSNAAVVPLGTAGAITVVAGVVSIDLVIDVNGYYGPQGGPGGLLPTGSSGQTLRHNAPPRGPNSAMTSDGTSIGIAGPLRSPSLIRGYTYDTIPSLKIEGLQTFAGQNAGKNLTTGGNLVGIGTQALSALTSGVGSVAVGDFALALGQTGSNNTAVGMEALIGSSGSGNIALGKQAGYNLLSGSLNMYLGNEGVNNDSGTIRIGTEFVHSRLFLAGVVGTDVGGNASPLYIDVLGQVGTEPSSSRYKDDVRDMAEASDRLLELRPVTFRYKRHPGDPLQFGLIAEEVEKVLPELVMKDADGRPQSVLYHEMPAMLLNELQKQQRRIEQQDDEIATLQERLERLENRLSSTATK